MSRFNRSYGFGDMITVTLRLLIYALCFGRFVLPYYNYLFSRTSLFWADIINRKKSIRHHCHDSQNTKSDQCFAHLLISLSCLVPPPSKQ